jgi:hypothetical protein
MSYAETLEQSDPYAVQYEAMLGYIQSHYGGDNAIEKAYQHWLSHHWY